MTMIYHGPSRWGLTRDREGYREYTLVSKVRSSTGSDGIYAALNTSGLPLPGSTWSVNGDIDPYAYCKQDAVVRPIPDEDGERGWYEVEQKFSNKGDEHRCKETQIDNPLLQPQKISGSFVKFQEEATHDRYGKRILTSSHEQIRGPQNEWDANRPQVKIEQNVAQLQLALFSQMVDTVNMYTLWGLPPRTIKLSNVQWSANFYGSCLVYYTRSLEFDIRYRRVYGVNSITSGTGLLEDLIGDYETWDRNLLDEGTKVLKGHWSSTTGAWVLERIGVLSAPNDMIGTEGGTGSLAADTYTYQITTVNAFGGESTPSTELEVTVTGSGNNILLSWTAVAGATAYRIYGRIAGSLVTPYGLLAEVTDVLYDDTGVATPDGNIQPPTNNGASAYPNKDIPGHFIRFQDSKGNVCRVILDGNGQPAQSLIAFGTGTGSTDLTSVGNIHIEKYGESDMLLLGVPTVLG